MKFSIRQRSGERLYSVRYFGLEQKLTWGVAALCVLTVITLFGYGLGVKYGHKDIVLRWQEDVHNQQQRMQALREHSQANIEALTYKVAYFQAHINRLNAFSYKLSAMADFDDSEIDFTQSPGLGGAPSFIEDVENKEILDGMELVLSELTKELEIQERKLFLLDALLAEQNFHKESLPEGRPVEKGWLSSHYGKRIDPFTGKQEFHKGIDFAGKHDSNVIAVAAGIVTRAESAGGYGNLVEVDHGNGYVTRYGHNHTIEVDVGEAVKKGQAIAKMGSTGRSTGPHVHFEVLKDNVKINPTKFIQSARQ
jgi:murein DD-endopeptidase MepM/ murein hydrolase activator NlpD